ncbi:hypothetical protein JYT83_00950 [bacterium AH-315-F18]|nr:hypothetical protein [bacterium AH-315-F18]
MISAVEARDKAFLTIGQGRNTVLTLLLRQQRARASVATSEMVVCR